MNDKEKRLVDISNQTGVSNWLIVLLITNLDSNYLSSNCGVQYDCNMVGKSKIYQHIVLAEVNLILSTV